MKQVPKQYLAPVQEFLINVLGVNKYSDAVITGGLIRDLTLGNEPKDTDVLIKTNLTVDEILAISRSLDVDFDEIEGYGEGHFTDNYKLLLRDLKHDIDYLFIHDHLTINKVIHSFDCSLNKGYALPHLGIIYPPNLDEFTFAGTDMNRFDRFYDMYYDHKVKQKELLISYLEKSNVT